MIILEILRINAIVGLKIVFHIGEKDGYIHDLVPVGSRIFQNQTNVLEHGVTLLFDVVGNNVPFTIQLHARNLLGSSLSWTNTRKKKQFPNAPSMRIKSNGFGCPFRIKFRLAHTFLVSYKCNGLQLAGHPDRQDGKSDTFARVELEKMRKKDGILVIGASGQIGTELVMELRSRHGSEKVVASDIKTASDEVLESGPFEQLDIMDRTGLATVIHKYDIGEVYLLAALLSATAEQKVMPAWNLNMYGLFYVLELAREEVIRKVYWPSSIAVFGPTTPKENTPQSTITEPTTVYGISKLAGERWCQYYHDRYGVDVRSLRYPGLIGYKSAPGGGTTDYAVEIFHKAVKQETLMCYLKQNARLPMMYMPDAIEATLQLMEAPSDQIRVRSSYNICGFDFTPFELSEAIRKHVPNLEVNYEPDSRQQIAESWPSSIDDSAARTDWGWENGFSMEEMVTDMLKHLSK